MKDFMKFNNYGIVALVVLFIAHLTAMDKQHNPRILPLSSYYAMINDEPYNPSALFIGGNNTKITLITNFGTIIWDLTDCLQTLKKILPLH